MSTEGCKKTRLALLWMNLCNEPLVALYTLLPFILRKDLGASLFQLSLFVTLKPVLSVFSFYWSAHLNKHRDKLLPNLIGAWVLARLPFLLLPMFPNVWFLLFAAGAYQLFSKASNPALIEILKVNVPKTPREKVYSFYYLLSFVESVVLGLSMGLLLDGANGQWEWLFFAATLIGLSSLIVQCRIPLPKIEKVVTAEERGIFYSRVVRPWQESFSLLRARPDFARFQWSFMIGGFGLMLIAPAFAVFSADLLSLSHADMALARLVPMGVGVALSSGFWRKLLAQTEIRKLICWMMVGFTLYPVGLICAVWGKLFLYAAFLLYGIAQAGSHLIWNLSGTLFASEENSTPFSTTNTLMVGLRGAVAPFLGGLLCDLFGALPVLLLGACTCLGGFLYIQSRDLALTKETTKTT